ncbi:FAD-linked oxidase [Lentzea guizhouensis]|uniref:FAD-linked oxidase n=1 Tax=Lentzea guizhouensis TaxID=1586287 RepID=A0A1B2HQ62_9PSEU|nr:FAD-linked oxidase C-terminal domain-containing protein [Lentzea guizhouensis]ANZ39842.1 FAD-linked oxidase [Lentzea guizhouensis]
MDSLLDRLRTEIGHSNVLTDPDVTGSYARDMMPLVPAGRPLAVALPLDTAGVQAVVRACAEHGVPVVPRGAGSGLTGAANAVDGCVVLSLAKLDRVLQVDPDDRIAVVQPGVITKHLRDRAAEHDLFYPPDPSSYDWCTIGGNLATNAGGLCCVKYGVTADSVLGLEVVLADGALLRTGRRTVKGVAGYDLTSLFVGSEGTLGVITEATLALRPRPPAPTTLVAAFASAQDAGHAVAEVVRAGLVPSLMEIMDAVSIEAAEAHLRTDLGAGDGTKALLLCQSDAGRCAGDEIAALERLCEKRNALFTHTTDDQAEGTMLLEARRVVLTALEARGVLLVDDVCVPRTKIAELILGCEEISADVGLTIAVVGHAGDGNMHPTIVFSGPSEEDRARQAFDSVLALGLSLGGTVTGEHGIGRLKRDWLAREIGEVGMAVHRSVKQALDPHGVLNPGAVLG